MDKICGTCGRWQPEQRTQKGSATYRSSDPLCSMTGKVKYAEEKPISWCHKGGHRRTIGKQGQGGTDKTR